MDRIIRKLTALLLVAGMSISTILPAYAADGYVDFDESGGVDWTETVTDSSDDVSEWDVADTPEDDYEVMEEIPVTEDLVDEDSALTVEVSDEVLSEDVSENEFDLPEEAEETLDGMISEGTISEVPEITSEEPVSEENISEETENALEETKDALEEAEEQFDHDECLEYVVETIRRFKPQVLVTHDENGEYGHGGHMYVSKLVREVTGRSAPEWVDSFLVLEAKNLLKYSGMAIKEIVYRMKFPDQSSFYKFFKLHTGMIPSEYRKS